MIVAAWAGIRFLKGFDIFGRNTVYYAAYDQIGGVQSASPVMMRGVKIGTVTGIAFDPQLSDKVVLQLTIKRQYRIPEDSEAKIVSSSLMGSKAIEITYGDSDVCLAKGDTLRSGRNRDLMDVAGSELEFFKQRVSRLTDDLSRTLDNVNRRWRPMRKISPERSATERRLGRSGPASRRREGTPCNRPSAVSRPSPTCWARMPPAWTASWAI